MNGITYFRFKSPYDGDVTKNCALDGYEVDNNFYTLEGRDIKSVDVVGDDIVIYLQNGEEIKARGVMKNNGITDISFDKTKGVLKVTKDGNVEEFSGFQTSYTTGLSVATDDTIIGNGQTSNPISISPIYKTSQFKPVDEYIDLTQGEKLDKKAVKPAIGKRILVKEEIPDYGYLYDYRTVRQIAYDLNLSHSKWRIPSKEDWDDMLNAVEPCDSDKTHNQANANKYLGKWAGKLLKSRNAWRAEGKCDTDELDEEFNDDVTTCITYDDDICPECEDINICNTTPFCGEKKVDKHKPYVEDENSGLDKYGFRILPAGYADDGSNIGFFEERAAYWTSTNAKGANAYIKRFEYNKSSVYQDIIGSRNFASLRLVKDYDGDNFSLQDEILGQPYPTVLMPSVKNGKAIWTAINIVLTNQEYNKLSPNNGQNIPKTVHFYINEWDGKKWLRNELFDGDSIVIKNAENGHKNVEYRIHGSKLMNVTEVIYHDILHEFAPKIHSLRTDLTNEVNRSTARDVELEDRLNSTDVAAEQLTERVTKSEQDIVDTNARIDSTNETVEHINTTLSDFGQQTATAFEQINEVLTQSINTINGAIQTEVDSRTAADEKLTSDLADETSAREAKDNEIEERVSSEVETINVTISEKEEAINTAIADETSTREAKDNELQDAIDENKAAIDSLNEIVSTETSNREESDAAIKNQLDELTDEVNEFEEKVAAQDEANEKRFSDIEEALLKEEEERTSADEKLTSDLADETSAREAKDTELEGDLLSADGTSYDKDSGVLTLKSSDGSNDISVQFSFNFGSF